MSSLLSRKRAPSRLAKLLLSLLALWIIFLGAVACAESTPSISIAYAKYESSALFWIAVDQGFLNRQGVAVNLVQYSSGVGALDGLMNGEADLAIGTNEFPLVARAFEGADVRTLACIAQSEFVYLVGRQDRGIRQPSNLKGKRVGAAFRTIAEFHLGRFLELQGLHRRDVTLVDIKAPDDWVDAVVEGTIDAIVTAQPYARAAREALGDNAVFWPAQSHQPLYTQVIARAGWIDAHPKQVRGLLHALAQAEDYIASHPAEAREIIQKWLDVDAGYMADVWAQNDFILSLDQSLILAMEDEARWMIANGLTTATKVPRFLDYIDERGLRAVKPEAVKIIR